MSPEIKRMPGARGQMLDVELSGPADGRPLIFHNGTPMRGVMFESMIRDGADRGIRHIAYSRPGYAGSERSEGRTVADCAADVEAIADALGVDTFLTVGWSGGGPHALACAALLPDRVLAAATIAGVAPADAEGLDWLAGMGEENVQEFTAVHEGAGALTAFLERERAGIMGSTAESFHASLGDLLSQVDRAAMTGEFARYMTDGMQGALRGGIAGWFDDDVAFFGEWGFDLGRIAVPVSIWQGAQDRFVPYEHGRWLAANVSGAAAHLPSDEGHLSLAVTSYGLLLDELIAAAA